ncbi:MAG: flagellar basal body-associated FliL family protein [Bdellovibrio sp.]|nr:flagellar basal body-associated FliL family protein [Bdellovibrio sp.]
MAEEKKEDTEIEGGTPPSPPKGPLILALANSLIVLITLGLLVFTQMLYKRPAITEQTERVKLEKKHLKQEETPPGYLQFEPVTINISSVPAQPRSAEGTPAQIHGKLHYVTLGFSLQIKDQKLVERLEPIRTKLMDQILGLLGKKTFNELVTVHGRYIVKNQILNAANLMTHQILNIKFYPITHVFFTQFIVQ